MLKNERNAYKSPDLKIVNTAPRKIICTSDPEPVSAGITNMTVGEAEDDSSFN